MYRKKCWKIHVIFLLLLSMLLLNACHMPAGSEKTEENIMDERENSEESSIWISINDIPKGYTEIRYVSVPMRQQDCYSNAEGNKRFVVEVQQGDTDLISVEEKRKIEIDGSQGTQFIYNGENIKYNGNEKEQIQEIAKIKKGERVLEWNAGKYCCRIYGSLSYEELKEIAKNVEVKSMKDIIVEIKGLEKTYGKNEAETKAIQGIDLTITREEFVSIVGKSGSGKSTLLNIIGGLERPTSGEVQIEGTNLFDMKDTSRTIFRRKHIGYVFQFFNLIPEMTVYENICLPSYLDHKDPDEDFIQTVMEKLGIYEKKGKYAAELSGGEQQRVAVARALSLKPSILLADEPSGNLDKKNGEQLLELMLLSQRYFDQTILLVTHDLEIARLSQRMIVLEDGKIISDTALEGEKS